MAVSSSGGATAVWSGYDGTSMVIRSSHRSPGGTWSAPATLSVTGQDGTDPEVAVDPTDRAVVTWVRFNGSKFVIQASVRATATSGWVQTEDLSEDSQSAFNPQVALDAAGNATAVWHRSTGTAGIVVQASRLSPGGSWSAGVDLSAETVDANAPRLAVDPSGNATAVWHTYDGSEYIVESASRPTNGPWSGKTEISNTGDSTFPEVTVDASGSATAVWSRSAAGGNNALVAARRSLGGAWTAPIDISVDAFPVSATDLTVDAAGDVTTVWRIKVDASTYNIEAAGLDVAGPVVTTFGVPAAGVAGKGVAFAVAATDNWSGVASYAWTFGDAGTAAGPSITHTYAQPGSYPVTLTVTDGVGNTTTRTATTTVTLPVPAFTVFKLTKRKIGREEKTKLKVGLTTPATLKLVLQEQAPAPGQGQEEVPQGRHQEVAAGRGLEDHHQGQEAEAGQVEGRRHGEERDRRQPEEESQADGRPLTGVPWERALDVSQPVVARLLGGPPR